MSDSEPKISLPGGAIFCDKEHVAELKKSIDIVGPLQSLVVDDETGEILVGKHRKNTGHSLPEVKKAVKSPLHRELIILHGNKQRQPKEEETKYHLVRIARMLELEGCPKHLWPVVNPSGDPAVAEMLKGKIPKDKIREVIQSLVPYSEVQVRRYLPSEYKMMSKARDQPGQICDHVIAKTSLADAPAEDPLGLGALTEHSEPAFPYPNCVCPNCPNKDKCY